MSSQQTVHYSRPTPTRNSTSSGSSSTLYETPTSPVSPTYSMERSSSQTKRQSTDSSQITNPWYGRHSNSWLFNDFSVTGTVSNAIHKLKRRDS